MMKKLILPALFFLGITTTQAQDFSFGVKAGLNYTAVEGEDVPSAYGYKFGGHAGLIANIGISEMVSVNPELVFSQKGYDGGGIERTIGGGKFESDAKQHLNYIDVPLLAQVKAGNLFFEIGPTAHFLLNAKRTYTEKSKDASGNVTSNRQTDRKNTAEYKNTDFGYAAGLGFRADNGLGIGLRYNGGLKSIRETNLSTKPKWHNSAFQLSLSYMLGSGK
jgi:hypothetical protein